MYGVRRELVARNSCSAAWAAKCLSKFVFLLVALVILPSCAFYSTPKPSKVILYKVKSGDSLYSISKRFGVTTREIRDKSKIPEGEGITVGQQLRIPYRGQDISKAKGTYQVSGREEALKAKPQAGALKSVKLSAAAKYVGKLIWPVGGGGGYLSSRFGRRWLSFHEGLDVAGHEGLPLLAAHSGQVVYSDDRIRGYGNMIVVRGDGLLTVYGHNKDNLVRIGQNVKQGDKIGILGQSGKATGPHLHYETRIRNADGKFAAVDPLVFYSKVKGD